MPKNEKDTDTWLSPFVGRQEWKMIKCTSVNWTHVRFAVTEHKFAIAVFYTREAYYFSLQVNQVAGN